MKNNWSYLLVAGMACAVLSPLASWADDFKDGISEFNDESIEADDKMGDKDTNINFVITDAVAKAKATKYQALQAMTKNLKANFNDGQDDNNQNSIVVEPGSKIGTVINIVEGKK